MDAPRLAKFLPGDCAGALLGAADDVTEVRLRAGRPPEIVRAGRGELVGAEISPRQLQSIAAAMLDNSLYAWENELRQGFFTLPDGCRVGVTGRFALREGKIAALTQINALCVRVSRQARGCADEIVSRLLARSPPMSALLLSRPGMGKTTLLRDIARQLSEGGWRVAIADERSELAAMRSGLPSLDVGPRTDVLDGCPKAEALPMLVRAMAPQVIVTDELGGPEDARAVTDAARAGVRVIASAHADSFREAEARAGPGELMRSGQFGLVALLGDSPGQLKALRTYDLSAGEDETGC